MFLLVPLSKSTFFTGVVSVALVSHSVARFSLESCSCCIRVLRVALVSLKNNFSFKHQLVLVFIPRTGFKCFWRRDIKQRSFPLTAKLNPQESKKYRSRTEMCYREMEASPLCVALSH